MEEERRARQTTFTNLSARLAVLPRTMQASAILMEGPDIRDHAELDALHRPDRHVVSSW